MDQLPLIGITLGDPAGIGPEVICKALSNHHKNKTKIYTPLVIGSKTIFDSELKKYDYKAEFNALINARTKRVIDKFNIKLSGFNV